MGKSLAEVQAIINSGGSVVCGRTHEIWTSLSDIPVDYTSTYCDTPSNDPASQASQVDSRTWTWDGGSSAPTTGVGDMVSCPIGGTITNVRVVAYNSAGVPTSGSAGITITKGSDPTALGAGTTATLTTATSSSAAKNVAVAAGDYIKAMLDTVAGVGVTKIKLFIDFTRTS
jgi:hypothetical protein